MGKKANTLRALWKPAAWQPPEVDRRGWDLFHYPIPQGLSLFDKFSHVMGSPYTQTYVNLTWLRT